MQDAIFIAAPPGTSWPLTCQDVEQHLQARFPHARTFQKFAPVSSKNYVDFEVTLGDMARHGSYFDNSNLILRDGSPEFWADTIVWFLSLLPTGTSAVAMVEGNPELIEPIAVGASQDEIQDLLESLIEAE
jgi:hypothetical protein